MTYQKCKTCKEFYWRLPHTCGPSWHVWDSDEGETFEDCSTVIFASSAEQAAIKYGQDMDSNGDYELANGMIYDVHVLNTEWAERLPPDDSSTRWTLYAESNPVYGARPSEAQKNHV